MNKKVLATAGIAALAVSATTIKHTLTKMQHEGKVIREGSNRKGKWILTDERNKNC